MALSTVSTRPLNERPWIVCPACGGKISPLTAWVACVKAADFIERAMAASGAGYIPRGR